MSPVDFALTASLLLLVPAYTLWRSLTGKDRPPDLRSTRYIRGIALAVPLLGLLAAAWIPAGRSAAALGLDIPVGAPGQIGLGIAAVLLLVLLVATRLPGKRAAAAPDAQAAALLPETRAEWGLFFVSMPLITTAWELLYRGYLVWALEPRLGTTLAVVLPATAYGVAHGYRGRGQFIGTLVAALLFTLGFVLTRSLWWLIAIHVALPVIGALAQRRLSRAAR
ncbi:MAG: CPBP family intramembrane glutamic endopeptidase [Pseudomonadota bacterium]